MNYINLVFGFIAVKLSPVSNASNRIIFNNRNAITWCRWFIAERLVNQYFCWDYNVLTLKQSSKYVCIICFAYCVFIFRFPLMSHSSIVFTQTIYIFCLLEWVEIFFVCMICNCLMPWKFFCNKQILFVGDCNVWRVLFNLSSANRLIVKLFAKKHR